jgi:hypothetical protein
VIFSLLLHYSEKKGLQSHVSITYPNLVFAFLRVIDEGMLGGIPMRPTPERPAPIHSSAHGDPGL